MANQGTTTYSFKDLSGAFVSPLAGPFTIAGGKVGLGQLVVKNTTSHGEQETVSDGAVMVSFISGDSGGCALECQQTSALHKFLLLAHNLHKTAADAGDVSQWAGSTIQARNILDGTSHLLTGVQFTKVPDKTYAGKGGLLTWELLAANVVNL